MNETNQYVTGATIKALREKFNMTQLQLAEKLCVSDKTVSKWETGKGYPDKALLKPIADAFSISVSELLLGTTISNTNISANMLRSKFYICPVCGNVIHAMGEAAVSCHGIMLHPEEAEEAEAEEAKEAKVAEETEETKEAKTAAEAEASALAPSDHNHYATVQVVEDEYYIQIDHEMTKDHYISFIAAVSPDRLQLVKLYPEGSAQARFRINMVKEIYFYCNRDGLFHQKVQKPKPASRIRLV